MRTNPLRCRQLALNWISRTTLALTLASSAVFGAQLALPSAASASPLRASIASASPQTGASGVLSITASSIFPGATVLLKGARFTTYEQVAIYFDGTQIGSTLIKPLGAIGVTDGVILAWITIPSTATPGPHTIKVVGEQTGVTSQIIITVEANWPEFNNTPSGDRYNPNETTIGVSNIASLTMAWSAPANFTADAPSILTDGVVYSSGLNGSFQALDETTGNLLWNAADAQPETAAAYANGVLYFGTGFGTMTAYSAATGAFIWRSPTGTGCYSFTPPTVAGSQVYFGDTCGNESAYTTGSCSVTCSPVWQTKFPGQINTSAAVANGDLYVTANGGVAVLNATTGALLYTDATTPSGGASSSVAVINGVVFVGTGADLLEAFDASGCGAATCSPLWTGQTGGAIFSTPAVANGIVYVTSQDLKLYAFNASGCSQSTCSPLWSALAGSAILSPNNFSPAIANGVVYVDGNDDNIYAFDANGCGATTCSALWQHTMSYTIQTSPFVVNGTLYIGTYPSGLFAFRPTTTIAKKQPTHTSVTAPSVPHGKTGGSQTLTIRSERHQAASTSSPYSYKSPAMPGVFWLW